MKALNESGRFHWKREDRRLPLHDLADSFSDENIRGVSDVFPKQPRRSQPLELITNLLSHRDGDLDGFDAVLLASNSE